MTTLFQMRGDYSPDFLTFWAAYPRKVGKGSAWRAWKHERPSLAVVLESLSWQVTQPQWTKDGGTYVPHPATWLNQRRWEDEPFHPPQDLTPDRRDSIGVSVTKAVLGVRAARGEAIRPESTSLDRLLASAFTGAEERRR